MFIYNVKSFDIAVKKGSATLENALPFVFIIIPSKKDKIRRG